MDKGCKNISQDYHKVRQFHIKKKHKSFHEVFF